MPRMGELLVRVKREILKRCVEGRGRLVSTSKMKRAHLFPPSLPFPSLQTVTSTDGPTFYPTLDSARTLGITQACPPSNPPYLSFSPESLRSFNFDDDGRRGGGGSSTLHEGVRSDCPLWNERRSRKVQAYMGRRRRGRQNQRSREDEGMVSLEARDGREEEGDEGGFRGRRPSCPVAASPRTSVF